MLPPIATFYLLAGATSAVSSAAAITSPAPTSTVISFAWAGNAAGNSFAPTTGISGSIIDVQSSLTTLVYTCHTTSWSRDWEAVEAYNNGSIGALCPVLSNDPQTVTYGANFLGQAVDRTYGQGYYGMLKTFDSEVVAHGVYGCPITAKPVPSGTPGAASATVDPTCTIEMTEFSEGLMPTDILPEMRCLQQDIVGDQSKIVHNQWNKAAYNTCLASMSASPTTKVEIPRLAEDVHYWTVTVTGVAEGASLQPTSSSAAGVTAQSTRSSAGAIPVDFCVSMVYVLGIVAVVLAL